MKLCIDLIGFGGVHLFIIVDFSFRPEEGFICLETLRINREFLSPFPSIFSAIDIKKFPTIWAKNLAIFMAITYEQPLKIHSTIFCVKHFVKKKLDYI